MNLPKPPAAYDATDQAQTRRVLIDNEKRALHIGDNIDLRAAKLILTASDGSRWQVVVSTSGALSTVAA